MESVLKDNAQFVEDISVKGMIHALVIRSPAARGILKVIEHPRLPNSYHLITAEHIPGKNQIADFPVPVLADKKISYIGEPVAILAGPEEARLESFASRFKVVVEEESPVFSASDDPGDTIIRREISAGTGGKEKRVSVPAPAGLHPAEEPGKEPRISPPAEPEPAVPRGAANPPAPAKDSAGQTPLPVPADSPPPAENHEKAPAEQEKQISGTYVTGIQEHWYSEAHGAVALPFSPRVSRGGEAELHPARVSAKAKKNIARNGAPERNNAKDEAFTIYTATQWPAHVRRSAALVLGLDSGKIQVRATLLAAHLDGKLWYPSLTACHAALAAWITGTPVKLMLTREEDFFYSPKRNRAEIGIRSVLGKKGEILDSSIRVKLDLGAQGIFEDEIMDHSCLGSLGAYSHAAYGISGVGIRTNIPPQGPMAGFGLSQGFFAAERHASHIADTLGRDPAEWRKENFLKKDGSFAVGTALKNSMPLAELIDATAQMSDYKRKWASYELLRSRRRTEKVMRGEPLRGIGIATAYQGSGFLYNDEKGNGSCAVELTLEKDGALEIKTNLGASGAGYSGAWENLAEEILGVEPALVRISGDSADAPDSGPATLSRNIGCLTRLVERCCTAIRKQRFRDPLPITVRRSAKPGREAGWIPGKNIDPNAFSRPAWGAAVAEIEIDPVSWVPVIRGIWLAVDGGKILSQRRARRTLAAGIIQALGWTCREQIRYEEGEIPRSFFRADDILAPAEIPPIHVDFIWNDTADPKGIGDLPFCCVPAAYVQAVSQALDHHFTGIPLDAETIWKAVQSKQTELSS